MAAWSDHERRDACKRGNTICPVCDGTGRLAVTPGIRCAVCQGAGVVRSGEFRVPRKLSFTLHRLSEPDDE
jgi:DnaJ-class molecular chaperone